MEQTELKNEERERIQMQGIISKGKENANYKGMKKQFKYRQTKEVKRDNCPKIRRYKVKRERKNE